MRPVATLARGSHLHVDDLVVDNTQRGSGIGAALMEYAERYARDHGLAAVFLDSRADVVGFYDRLGYSAHPAQLMRKSVL
jgi:ribosomal protein S18 acetylase RimI-like enzyme